MMQTHSAELAKLSIQEKAFIWTDLDSPDTECGRNFILEISAGWNRTGPNSNHEREPFTSIPRKITAISSNMTNPYIGNEALSYIRGGTTNRIKTAIMRAVVIHTNCLPLRLPKSKIEAGSEACTDA